MSYYENELRALKKSNRLRSREVIDESIKDFASNDYLGLAHIKELHSEVCQELDLLGIHASKASMLVNGYHQIHQDFERAMSEANGFEECIVMGSGFNANLALIESLCRKGDMLFMDELYHASGVMATHFESVNVVFFKHNNMQELKNLLEHHKGIKRKIIAVEGIYSMDGDMCDGEIFSIADTHDALLIVDEAHSSGVVGVHLMGVFDHYDVAIKPNYIKMGTLGKAYGSFGAFILASHHIVEYLLNRAKPIVYATSLSLYDTLLAHKSLNYILENTQEISREIKLRKMVISQELGSEVAGLIVPIEIGDNKKVLEIKDRLYEEGFAIGGIRQPTVPSAILRVIARLGESESQLRKLCKQIAQIKSNKLKFKKKM